LSRVVSGSCSASLGAAIKAVKEEQVVLIIKGHIVVCVIVVLRLRFVV
jgi:hypothetical protein